MNTTPKLNVIPILDDERPGMRANMSKLLSGLGLSALSVVLGVLYDRGELSFSIVSGVATSGILLFAWFIAMCLREDRLSFSDVVFRLLLVALAVMLLVLSIIVLGAQDSLQALIGAGVVGLWGSLMVWNILTTWWPNNRAVRNRGD